MLGTDIFLSFLFNSDRVRIDVLQHRRRTLYRLVHPARIPELSDLEASIMAGDAVYQNGAKENELHSN